jgi:hypothetical protein
LGGGGAHNFRAPGSRQVARSRRAAPCDAAAWPSAVSALLQHTGAALFRRSTVSAQHCFGAALFRRSTVSAQHPAHHAQLHLCAPVCTPLAAHALTLSRPCLVSRPTAAAAEVGKQQRELPAKRYQKGVGLIHPMVWPISLFVNITERLF